MIKRAEFDARGHLALYQDSVNHPAHYNQLDIECIDVVEHFSFNIGSAIKYLWRCGAKPGAADLEDLQKAAWYVQREIERRTNQAR